MISVSVQCISTLEPPDDELMIPASNFQQLRAISRTELKSRVDSTEIYKLWVNSTSVGLYSGIFWTSHNVLRHPLSQGAPWLSSHFLCLRQFLNFSSTRAMQQVNGGCDGVLPCPSTSQRANLILTNLMKS